MDETCKKNIVDVYIAACKQKKIEMNVSKTFCKVILDVVGEVVKTTHHFITLGVPTSWGGDEQIAALRKVFGTLPEPIDHKHLFLTICNRICKYSKAEREKMRAEKEKARNLKRQQSKEKKEESDKKKVAELLKPHGEHVGKASPKKIVAGGVKAVKPVKNEKK